MVSDTREKATEATLNQDEEQAYSFFIEQPVAVYWGQSEKNTPELYPGIVTDVNSEEVTITLNFGDDEIVPRNEWGNIIPLKINPSTKGPLSKADFIKIRDEGYKISTLDQNKYLDKYTSEIEVTLETLDKLSEELKNNEEQVNSKIYAVAKILSTAREEAKDEATRLKDEKLEKKLFSQLKSQVVKKFNASSRRNLDKAIKVASDKRISENQNRLPVAHTVLYSLTSLTNEEFERLLEDEDVTPNTSREDLLKKIRGIKGKEQKKQYTIFPAHENKASDKDIKELEKILESKGWKLKESRTNAKSKT